jgi:hypothetical protein
MTGTDDFCACTGGDHASITEAMTDTSPSRLIDHSHSYATPSTRDGLIPILTLSNPRSPNRGARWT